MSGALDVDALRSGTPGCAHRAHLNNAGAALMSQRTLDAMTGQLHLEAQIGGYEAQAAAAEVIGATYDALARLVGGSPAQIALFDNSTRAWNAAFYSVPFKRGDRMLTSRAEYGSNVLAYLQVAERTGVEVDVVPNDESGQIDVEQLERMIDDRVRLISLTWIPTGLYNRFGQEDRDVHPLVRLSPHYYNVPSELDLAATAIEGVTARVRT